MLKKLLEVVDIKYQAKSRVVHENEPNSNLESIQDQSN